MKKLALAMLLAWGASSALAAVELKLGHFASDTHPCGIAAQQFKANVEKLRELSPLWDMFKEGVDLSKVEWQAH